MNVTRDEFTFAFRSIIAAEQWEPEALPVIGLISRQHKKRPDDRDWKIHFVAKANAKPLGGYTTITNYSSLLERRRKVAQRQADGSLSWLIFDDEATYHRRIVARTMRLASAAFDAGISHCRIAWRGPSSTTGHGMAAMIRESALWEKYPDEQARYQQAAIDAKNAQRLENADVYP